MSTRDPNEPQMAKSLVELREALDKWSLIRFLRAIVAWIDRRLHPVPAPEGECANCPVEREKTDLWRKKADAQVE